MATTALFARAPPHAFVRTPAETYPSSLSWRFSSAFGGFPHRLVAFSLPFSSQKKRPGVVLAALGSALRDQATANAEGKAEPDPWVDNLVQKLMSPGGDNAIPDALGQLRVKSYNALKNARLPTSKEEAWRFTDLKGLRNAAVVPAVRSSSSAVDVSSCTLSEADASRVVIVDGLMSPDQSNLQNLPPGVVIAPLSSLQSEDTTKLAERLGVDISGDTFSALNGFASTDVLVIGIPPGVSFISPVHLVYYSTAGEGNKGGMTMSCSRTLVVVGAGGEVEIVEEFVGGSGGAGYLANSVTEVFLEKEAKVVHGYLEHQAREAYHIKRTFVSQAKLSEYSMVEAGWGGKLTRHNFVVQQRGPETVTEIGTYYLCGRQQLHDLHSSIVLDHPSGKSNQLHKCIVTDSSGHGVFDGNVRVNRYAQQTDAQQLSRNLLLAPRATVNVKPNLQIIADDVKCTHGAAISDLEEEQLFYFRARGIDENTARSALVYSFGCEVIEKLRHEGLRKRIEEGIKKALAAEGALDMSAV